MAEYQPSDRVQIRRYLGFSNLYLQADPRLESAITASQASADGGVQPDNSLQVQILADVASCQAIDAAIVNLRQAMGASKVEDINLDTAREHARLKQEGSMYCGRIARALDVEAYFDPYFETMVVLRESTTLGTPFVRNAYR